MRKIRFMMFVVSVIVGFDVYLAFQYYQDARQREQLRTVELDYVDEYFIELDEYMVPLEGLTEGGEHFRPLRFAYDLPGVAEPKMLDADAVELPDQASVIGIEVDGYAYAFSMKTMGIETNHIVNFMQGQRPLTVTYCPLADCVRVLTRDENELIPLRLGGLNDQDMMVVILDEKRYDQSSEALPLEDYAFTRTTFRDWKRHHPHTKVFVDQSIVFDKI